MLQRSWTDSNSDVPLAKPHCVSSDGRGVSVDLALRPDVMAAQLTAMLGEAWRTPAGQRRAGQEISAVRRTDLEIGSVHWEYEGEFLGCACGPISTGMMTAGGAGTQDMDGREVVATVDDGRRVKRPSRRALGQPANTNTALTPLCRWMGIPPAQSLSSSYSCRIASMTKTARRDSGRARRTPRSLAGCCPLALHTTPQSLETRL
ncbi:uncharacterized protein J3D65DRAFT_606657 [Phyllosticta citribraziliensis]|uniref:Uncharacterized protein n=1 Tax=Phyllosticta citribraziliensis TaxID=989973 RepID=A0ABR1L8L7_9PEZI